MCSLIIGWLTCNYLNFQVLFLITTEVCVPAHELYKSELTEHHVEMILMHFLMEDGTQWYQRKTKDIRGDLFCRGLVMTGDDDDVHVFSAGWVSNGCGGLWLWVASTHPHHRQGEVSDVLEAVVCQTAAVLEAAASPGTYWMSLGTI